MLFSAGFLIVSGVVLFYGLKKYRQPKRGQVVYLRPTREPSKYKRM